MHLQLSASPQVGWAPACRSEHPSPPGHPQVTQSCVALSSLLPRGNPAPWGRCPGAGQDQAQGAYRKPHKVRFSLPFFQRSLMLPNFTFLSLI